MKIFITGISSGIGRALAKQCIEAGDEVWGVARRVELLSELVEEVKSDRLHVSAVDVTDLDALRAVIASMRQAFFIPDVIILNAGGYFKDITQEAFHFDIHRESFATNVDAALFLVAEWLPDFLARKSGMFIAVSSTAAFRPSGSASYSASRAALSMAFRQFRLSFSQTGIRFTTVHFGPIATRQWPGRRMFLVPSPERAATFVVRMFDRRGGLFFFPRVTTTIMRLGALVPDEIFRWLSSRLLKSDRDHSRE